MTADGKSFERQTAPFPDPDTQACAADAQCPGGEYCNPAKQKCSKRSFRTSLSDPEWAPDGKTLYFTHGQTWISGTTLAGGTGLASVPVGAGGAGFKTYSLNGACQTVGAPVAAASGASLAVNRNVCASPGVDGWFRYDLPAFTGNAPLVVAGGGLSVGTEKGAFLGTDQFLLLGTVGSSAAIVVSEPATGAWAEWATPEAGADYWGFSVSPDQKWVVACKAVSSATDLWLLPTGGGSPQRITTDGRSCHPAW